MFKLIETVTHKEKHHSFIRGIRRELLEPHWLTHTTSENRESDIGSSWLRFFGIILAKNVPAIIASPRAVIITCYLINTKKQQQLLVTKVQVTHGIKELLFDKNKTMLIFMLAYAFYILCSTKNTTIQNNSNCYISTLFYSVFLVRELSHVLKSTDLSIILCAF